MKLEKILWKGYAALNKRRKSKESVPALFKILDDIRRLTGFVR